jgi:hypothetical protein
MHTESLGSSYINVEEDVSVPVFMAKHAAFSGPLEKAVCLGNTVGCCATANAEKKP